MYQFKIGHNSSPCTKFLHWTFHIKILLPATISMLSTSGSHKMKPWQWKFLNNNLGFVKKQTDSFLQSLHCFNHLQTHHLALLPLYVKNTAGILARCSLQIRKSSDVSMPSQLTPNVWILMTAPSAATVTITLICLRETTQFIKVERPIHLLCLPSACSATSPSFHLPPHYEGPPLEVNISMGMANLNMINISSVNFHIWLHLEKHWNESQLSHLASIPSVQVEQLYHHILKGFECVTPFSPENSTRRIPIQYGHCSHIQEFMLWL